VRTHLAIMIERCAAAAMPTGAIITVVTLVNISTPLLVRVVFTARRYANASRGASATADTCFLLLICTRTQACIEFSWISGVSRLHGYTNKRTVSSRARKIEARILIEGLQVLLLSPAAERR